MQVPLLSNKPQRMLRRIDLSTDHMLDESVVRAMHIDCSVEGVVDSQTSDVWSAHVSIQMKMDWVSTQTEGLASMGNLNVAQAKHRRFRVSVWCMCYDVSTKLVTTSLRTEPSLEAGLGHKLPWKKTPVKGRWFTPKHVSVANCLVNRWQQKENGSQ